tara:strand:+ start:94 stop:441 length:348 start_codon:yes stop_codon:yes gene_type:complete
MRKMLVITAGELTIVIIKERAKDQVKIKDPLIKTAAIGMTGKIQRTIKIEAIVQIKENRLANIRNKITKEVKEVAQLIDQTKVQKRISADLLLGARKIQANAGEVKEASYRKLKR